MLVVDVFSAPSLALKSFMFAQLYRAMVQTVGIVFFLGKTFWFRQCAIDITPLNLVSFTHFFLARRNECILKSALVFLIQERQI